MLNRPTVGGHINLGNKMGKKSHHQSDIHAGRGPNLFGRGREATVRKTEASAARHLLVMVKDDGAFFRQPSIDMPNKIYDILSVYLRIGHIQFNFRN